MWLSDKKLVVLYFIVFLFFMKFRAPSSVPEQDPPAEG